MSSWKRGDVRSFPSRRVSVHPGKEHLAFFFTYSNLRYVVKRYGERYRLLAVYRVHLDSAGPPIAITFYRSHGTVYDNRFYLRNHFFFFSFSFCLARIFLPSCYPNECKPASRVFETSFQTPSCGSSPNSSPRPSPMSLNVRVVLWETFFPYGLSDFNRSGVRNCRSVISVP